MSKEMRGNLMLLITAIIWGLSFVAQVIGAKHVGPYTFIFSRSIITVVFLYFVIKLWPTITGKPLEVETPEMKSSTIRGGIAAGIALTLANILQQIGIGYTTAGKAGFITSLYIVIVPLLGMFLGDRVDKRTWLAVAIASVGLYLLSIKKGDFSIGKGDMFILFCALAYAIHIIVVGKYSAQSHGVKMSLYQFMVVTVISFVLMIAFETPRKADIMAALLAILYSGIFSAGVGFTLQIVAQKYTKPTMASMILSTESVFSAIFGALLLKEVLSSRELLGCVLMFAAIILAQIPERRVRE